VEAKTAVGDLYGAEDEAAREMHIADLLRRPPTRERERLLRVAGHGGAAVGYGGAGARAPASTKFQANGK
jgi:hypothetical protein